MKAKLKPCPFCGGNAVLWADEFNPRNGEIAGWVTCTRCRAFTATYSRIRDAIKRWNTRVK